MKNKHLLLITATVAFLTFYLPVEFITTKVNPIPLWLLPIFWMITQLPFWFNELAWRTSRLGGETYNMFHQLHFEGINWKKQKANVWLIVSKFFKWWVKEPICIIGTLITLTALGYGVYDFYNDVMEPFLPYYVMLCLWWVYFTRSFFEFKEKAKYGYISYIKHKKSTTHFSPEWYDEQERLRQLNEERSQNSKK
jgi:hypothetical protein